MSKQGNKEMPFSTNSQLMEETDNSLMRVSVDYGDSTHWHPSLTHLPLSHVVHLCDETHPQEENKEQFTSKSLSLSSNADCALLCLDSERSQEGQVDPPIVSIKAQPGLRLCWVKFLCSAKIIEAYGIIYIAMARQQQEGRRVEYIGTSRSEATCALSSSAFSPVFSHHFKLPTTYSAFDFKVNNASHCAIL
jgi:hypothetical protein